MSPQPVTGGGGVSDFAPAPIVAKFTALVSTEVLFSNLAVEVEAEHALMTLRAAPEWVDAWPPRPLDVRTEHRQDVETLVIARLKTLFDFGAQLPDEEVGDLQRHMIARWPELLSPEAREAAEGEGPYERISVTALVRADGNPEWGYERSPTSGRPLPLAAGDAKGRTELDLFVQNLIRSELEARLADGR